jgi:Fe-S cluster assembly iron-binding protein IscA
MITLEPGAGQALRALLQEKGAAGPLRIHLQSSGCCDPSLSLSLDAQKEGDVLQEAEGVTFIISPETLQLTGEVRIAYVEEEGKKGFILTSQKPISEWEGFGLCSLNL